MPSTPKGTRDFLPDVVRKRNYIFGTIRQVFEKYGYQPIETPAMENLETLTGKYGEEGDRLIFKILQRDQQLQKAFRAALNDGERAPLGSPGAKTNSFVNVMVNQEHVQTFYFYFFNK